MSAPSFSTPTEPEIAESGDETLRRLARMLDFAAPGRFVLAFVKCNLPVQRRVLVEQLKVLLEPLGVSLIEIELNEPVDRLLPRVKERLAGSYLVSPAEPEHALALRESRGKVAVFVYGLEHSLPSSDPKSGPVGDLPLLAHLNLSRELFRRDVPCPLVIWLPDYALTMVARRAPDFWAWRSGVYEFAAEPETAQRIAQMTVYDEAGHVTSSLPAEAKRERLHLLARLLEDYRELGDGARERRTQADILWKMGDVHYDLGEWKEAQARCEEALELARALDEPRTVAGLLHQLGMLAQATGDLAEARRLYDQSLGIKRELGDKRGIAQSLHQLGRRAEEEGNLAEAWRLFEESLRMLSELGSPDANVAKQSLERVKQRIGPST
ncbi:MAG TPA: tetratricopeptide repeat protein, partial [Anaerolineae bacterium]